MNMQNGFDDTQAVSGDLQTALEEMKSDRAAEKYKAIKELVDRVGYGLAQDKMLTFDEKLKEWVAMLTSTVKLLPKGYEKTREIFLEAIAHPRHEDYDEKLLRRKRGY